MPIVKVSLTGNYNNRTGATTKDCRLLNCYVEQIKEVGLNGQERVLEYVIKRPGITTWGDATAISTGEPRGLYSWVIDDPATAGILNFVYGVYGDDVVQFDEDDAGNRAVTGGTFATTTRQVYFNEELANGRLFFRVFTSSGTLTELWYIDNSATTTKVEVVDADYTAAEAVGGCFGLCSLDGYLFIGTFAGAQIYNSNLEDGTNWTAGGLLTANTLPEIQHALVNYKNYIVSLKSKTINFFYDAANAAGSPLAIVEGSVQNIGCKAGASVQADQNIVLFLGSGASGNLQIFALDGVNVAAVSSPAIERIITTSPFVQGSGSGDNRQYRAELFRVNGKFFYLLNISNVSGASTLVFDIGLKKWSEWQSNLVAETNNWQLGLKDIISTYYDSTVLGNATFTGHTGKVYELTSAVYRDITTNIAFEVVTPIFDFGSNKQKFMHRLTLLCDEQTSTSNITVEYSDDDYITWSTARTLDMSKSNPTLYSLGSFKRRAFRLKSSANTPIRIEGMEFDLSEGTYVGGNQ